MLAKGISYLTLDDVNPNNPTPYGIFVGAYGADIDVFPDGSQVEEVAVRLSAEAGGLYDVASYSLIMDISDLGTDGVFGDVPCRGVEVMLVDVPGTFYGMAVAGLAEIEGIVRGNAAIAAR